MRTWQSPEGRETFDEYRNTSWQKKKVEPDYDDLPRGDPNPMWEVAIGILILLAVLGALLAIGG